MYWVVYCCMKSREAARSSSQTVQYRKTREQLFLSVVTAVVCALGVLREDQEGQLMESSGRKATGSPRRLGDIYKEVRKTLLVVLLS